MKATYNLAAKTIGLEVTPSELHEISQNLHGDFRRDFAAILTGARRVFTAAARVIPRKPRR